MIANNFRSRIHRKAELITFTFDTNCLIDIAEDRQNAAHIHKLLAHHKNHEVDIALVASSASERQQGEKVFLDDFQLFDARRKALGFGTAQLLPSIGRYDVSFFGHSLSGSDDAIAREHAIFRVLAGGSDPEWTEYAASKELDVSDKTAPGYFRWRNKMLDAQAFWAHDHAKRDVFVTSDKRFKNLNNHVDFPTAHVVTPMEATDLI